MPDTLFDAAVVHYDLQLLLIYLSLYHDTGGRSRPPSKASERPLGN